MIPQCYPLYVVYAYTDEEDRPRIVTGPELVIGWKPAPEYGGDLHPCTVPLDNENDLVGWIDPAHLAVYSLTLAEAEEHAAAIRARCKPLHDD